MSFQFYQPTRIIFGAGKLNELGEQHLQKNINVILLLRWVAEVLCMPPKLLQLW